MSEDMSGAGGGTGGGGGIFVPKEDLVQALTNMGITRNAATRALYLTGNYSADLAAAWIFENPEEDVDAPFTADAIGIDDTNSDDDVEDFTAGVMTQYKMVMVVNSELMMGAGKVAGQVAHAAVGMYRLLVDEQQRYGEMLLTWEQFGETKIVLKGLNAAHLRELQNKAGSIGLPHYAVQDAGKTQIAPGSLTVIAIFGKSETVNEVTGQLALM